MRYIKILGLAAVGVMALMAFVGPGTASADELCTNDTGSACTKVTTIDASLIGGTAALLDTEAEEVNTCTGGTAEGAVSTQGAGKDISGSIAKKDLTWSGCSFPTTTLAGGSMIITHIGVGHDGRVTNAGMEVTIHTFFFGSCIYGTGSGTHLGTLKGGSNASLDINVVVHKIFGSAFACPTTAVWDAEYQITNHSSVYVRNT